MRIVWLLIAAALLAAALIFTFYGFEEAPDRPLPGRGG